MPKSTCATAAQVLRAIGVHIDPGRDLFVHDGPPHPFDSAQSAPGALATGIGRAIGIDATTKLPDERAGRPPRRMVASDEMTDLLDRRWQEYGLNDGG